MKTTIIALLLSSLCGATAYAKLYIHKNKDYALSYKQYETHQEVKFSGEMILSSPIVGLDFIQKKLVKNLDVHLYIYGSHGGLDAHFDRLSAILKSACHKGKKQTCTLITYNLGTCGSACVELFLSGDVRIATKDSSFGFHRTWIFRPNWVVISAKRMANRYVRYGVNKEWLYSNLNIFTDDQTYLTWVSSPSLVAPGLVHALVRNQ